MINLSRKLLLSAGLATGLFALSACEPVPGGSANVSAGLYYDSLLWNDYYYGNSRPGYRPPPDRPVRPSRPVDPGFSRPPRPIDPGFSRPSRPSVPHHRPAGGRGRR